MNCSVPPAWNRRRRRRTESAPRRSRPPRPQNAGADRARHRPTDAARRFATGTPESQGCQAPKRGRADRWKGSRHRICEPTESFEATGNFIVDSRPKLHKGALKRERLRSWGKYGGGDVVPAASTAHKALRAPCVLIPRPIGCRQFRNRHLKPGDTPSGSPDESNENEYGGAGIPGAAGPAMWIQGSDRGLRLEPDIAVSSLQASH